MGNGLLEISKIGTDRTFTDHRMSCTINTLTVSKGPGRWLVCIILGSGTGR
jgi:hypothetical protein